MPRATTSAAALRQLFIFFLSTRLSFSRFFQLRSTLQSTARYCIFFATINSRLDAVCVLFNSLFQTSRQLPSTRPTEAGLRPVTVTHNHFQLHRVHTVCLEGTFGRRRQEPRQLPQFAPSNNRSGEPSCPIFEFRFSPGRFSLPDNRFAHSGFVSFQTSE